MGDAVESLALAAETQERFPFEIQQLLFRQCPRVLKVAAKKKAPKEKVDAAATAAGAEGTAPAAAAAPSEKPAGKK